MIPMEKMTGGAPADRPPVPVHEQVYQQLRAQILFGEMAPGQAVTIQGLRASLGAGTTPVREAIRRLISDGALTFRDNRRVSVPVLTHADVMELTNLRKTIEYQLAYLAAQRLDTAMTNRLGDIKDRLDAAVSGGDVTGYLHENYLFHTTLYASASAPITSELADRFWLRVGPSLRMVCGLFGTRNLPDRHKDVLDALHSRDADATAQAIALDVDWGMQQVATMLSGAR